MKFCGQVISSISCHNTTFGIFFLKFMTICAKMYLIAGAAFKSAAKVIFIY